jgi:hypothetical protein
MTWNATFPTPPLVINQSINQFQTNWNTIATTIGQDHFFNAAGVTNGTHKYVNLTNQSPDPPIAAFSNAVEFTRSMGPLATPNIIPSWPHFSNNLYTYRNVLGFSRQHNGGPGSIPLFTFNPAGPPGSGVNGPIAGTFFVYQDGVPTNFGSIDYIWDGTTLARIPGSFAGTGTITAMNVTGGNTMNATVGVNGTYNWAFNAIPFGV